MAYGGSSALSSRARTARSSHDASRLREPASERVRLCIVAGTGPHPIDIRARASTRLSSRSRVRIIRQLTPWCERGTRDVTDGSATAGAWFVRARRPRNRAKCLADHGAGFALRVAELTAQLVVDRRRRDLEQEQGGRRLHRLVMPRERARGVLPAGLTLLSAHRCIICATPAPWKTKRGTVPDVTSSARRGRFSGRATAADAAPQRRARPRPHPR